MLFLILVILFNLYFASGQVVHIKQGTLVGFRNVSRQGKEYVGFLGIPYAKPPVNELRFQDPQPHPGWSGERDATKMNNVCPQVTILMPNATFGHEDCLYLNVYTPEADVGAKLPVMFLIHGGGFRMGAANFYNEKFFMDQNVVLVSINYRLGVLGFLSFADEEWVSSPLVNFPPVVDSYLGQDAFLPDHPLKLSPNNVNAIIGLTMREGNLVAIPMCKNEFQLAKELEADLANRLPILMCIQDHVDYKDRKKISEDLMNFYLKGEKIDEHTVGENFQELGTDLLFTHGSYKSALHYYKRIPVYFYLFDIAIPEPNAFTHYLGNCSSAKGSTPPLTKEDDGLSKEILQLWTTFAAKGVPDEIWTPVVSDKIEYLYMTREGFSMRSGLFESRLKFVNSLPLDVNKYKLDRERNEL
ncbi:hypothetical protein M8J76_003409 [Diaphorina citri]|nr:hypothetical protein M8J76_003409 [Diaphorina citri]